MSENIALALFESHKTAEPTGVGAPVLETGTVSVSPFPLEIRCIAQAITFHGLCQDDRGNPLGLQRSPVGVVDLCRIVAAAPQLGELLVRHVGDQQLLITSLATG